MSQSAKTKTDLLAKLESRNATVAIIGLGYVGLPLAVEFAKAGLRVIGYDVSKRLVDAVKKGQSHVQDVSAADVAAMVKAGRFIPTTDESMLAEADAISIAVPTPLVKTRDPDMSYVIAAAEAIGRHAHPGMVIVLESTTYPGTTREVLLPLLLRARPRRSARTSSSRSVRSGSIPATRLSDDQHAEGRRRHHAGVHRGRHRPLLDLHREHRRGLVTRGRGAGQAAREHLPLGEHRARQRDGDRLRQARRRRLGSDRRRRPRSRSAS